MVSARIRPLAWEPPYAAGEALEKTEKKKEYILGKNKDQLDSICILNMSYVEKKCSG